MGTGFKQQRQVLHVPLLWYRPRNCLLTSPLWYRARTQHTLTSPLWYRPRTLPADVAPVISATNVACWRRLWNIGHVRCLLMSPRVTDCATWQSFLHSSPSNRHWRKRILMNGAVQQQDRIVDFKYFKTKSSIFKLLLSLPLPVGERLAILETTRLETVSSFKRHSSRDLSCVVLIFLSSIYTVISNVTCHTRSLSALRHPRNACK